MDHLCLVFSCFCICSLLPCCERADILALVGDVYCMFCYFHMWYPGSGLALDCMVS